jgi:hypothetical protein
MNFSEKSWMPTRSVGWTPMLDSGNCFEYQVVFGVFLEKLPNQTPAPTPVHT